MNKDEAEANNSNQWPPIQAVVFSGNYDVRQLLCSDFKGEGE